MNEYINRDYINKDEILNEILNDKFSFIGSPDEVMRHDAICDYAIDMVNSQTVYKFDR